MLSELNLSPLSLWLFPQFFSSLSCCSVAPAVCVREILLHKSLERERERERTRESIVVAVNNRRMVWTDLLCKWKRCSALLSNVKLQTSVFFQHQRGLRRELFIPLELSAKQILLRRPRESHANLEAWTGQSPRALNLEQAEGRDMPLLWATYVL